MRGRPSLRDSKSSPHFGQVLVSFASFPRRGRARAAGTFTPAIKTRPSPSGISPSPLNSPVVCSTERHQVVQVVHGPALSQRDDVVNGQVPLRLTALSVLDRCAALTI